MKKLNAFTIVELCVTLLISGIVIGIAYYAYLLFMNQYKVQKSKSDLTAEYLLFRKAMQSDIDRSDFIIASASALDFENLNSPGGVIYNFEDSFVTRKFFDSEDTFRVKKMRHEFFYVDDSSNLVNKIQVSFSLDKEQVDADFNKLYSSQQLLRNAGKNE